MGARTSKSVSQPRLRPGLVNRNVGGVEGGLMNVLWQRRKRDAEQPMLLGTKMCISSGDV